MPTYGYRCEKNGHEFEVVQGINEPPLTRCKICGSKVRRIFYPVGIVFKGPGFYKTDSRGSSSITSSDGDRGSADRDKGSSDKGGAAEKAATIKKGEAKGKSDSKGSGDSKSKKSG
ncbi:MAG TPA: FmdB family zinc ribbon protein [Candidatus Dormibacteraeota bacterium]|jgi:putative FmdB family regulatory protein|nr:FmdB family zinc ribbon protein [Candidatus Dormibacteraeota bacterium]